LLQRRPFATGAPPAASLTGCTERRMPERSWRLSRFRRVLPGRSRTYGAAGGTPARSSDRHADRGSVPCSRARARPPGRDGLISDLQPEACAAALPAAP
jgi:hypothetical protein